MATIQLRTRLINQTVVVERATYPNGSTALVLKDEDGQPLVKATTVVDGELPGEGNVFIKDWSENAGMLEGLQRAGIVGPVIRTVPHGHVEAQEVELLVPLAGD